MLISVISLPELPLRSRFSRGSFEREVLCCKGAGRKMNGKNIGVHLNSDQVIFIELLN